jgi:hypothetical protein
MPKGCQSHTAQIKGLLMDNTGDDAGAGGTGGDDAASKPFILLGKKGQGSGMQLKYGERPDDPAPFILIVTPAYVAEKTGKPSASYNDVVRYVEAHGEELRAIAIHQRDRGYATEVLS